MTKKRDGARDMYAYVSAVRKQGAKLLPIEAPRTAKEERKRKAALKAALKKATN